MAQTSGAPQTPPTVSLGAADGVACDTYLEPASRQPPRTADEQSVKFERLVLESGDNQTTLDLHPQLTVVSGLGPVEREGLMGELVGSLGSARSGVHLELVTDSGRRMAIFRPQGAAHRVVDVDARSDVTASFTDADGGIDLLARAGLDAREARRLMRLSSQSLTEATEGDEIAAALAKVDQQELWTAAELLVRCRDHLDDEAAAAGTSAEDAAVVARIEQRHTEFEHSQEQSEGIRKVTFVLAGLAALATLPVAQRTGTVGVTVLAACAALAVGVSLIFWRRTERARRREDEALAEAGARSYLGFHLQRVNSLLSSDHARRRLLKAAEEHRDAAARWHALAGDVDVDWALARRSRIVTSARLSDTVHTVDLTTGDGRPAPRPAPRPLDGRTSAEVAGLAHALLDALADVRDVGGSGESFPLVVDEAFEHVEPSAVPALLELLMRGSLQQQVVVLTGTATIENWARLEAMTGNLNVLELRPATRVA